MSKPNTNTYVHTSQAILTKKIFGQKANNILKTYFFFCFREENK